MYNINSINTFSYTNNNTGINITTEKVLKNAIARIDLNVPAAMKTALKEVSNATKTTMTDIIIRALMFYLNNLGISETELNLIVVNRDEYIKLIEEKEELEKEVEKLSKNEEKYNKSEEEMEKLKKELEETNKVKKGLEKKVEKLEKKVERYEKKDPILKLENILEELPKPELSITEAFTRLNITHAHDKSKFINLHTKLNKELSTKYITVYSFLDDRLANYIIITKNGIFDGTIIRKSRLDDIIAQIKEEIEKQKEIERLRLKMKDYINPIELELMKIRKRHPELSSQILDYIAKLNRAENPHQLLSIINEITEWLKHYSIMLSESDKVIELIKKDEQESKNSNSKERWRLLR